jgi:peroxiredoxin/RimJ/RimL family protein N-acetyltransferase
MLHAAVTDLHALPADLPVPADDGAARHLLGMRVPASALPTTTGEPIDLAAAATAAGTLVLYVYPATGVPGRPLPDGWDAIPGARGCTPQSCAFRDHARELAELGASVVGLSAQPLEEQRAFAAREHLPFPLVNDSAFTLAEELDLPTFEAAGQRYYRRLTLVAHAGRIAKVFYPVFPPQENAAQVIAWLRAERPVLRGQRMLLRPAAEADAPALAAILAEPDVAAWWGAYDLARVRADLREETTFAILLDGAVAGWLHTHEERDPAYPSVAFDIALTTRLHGQGYGREALRLAIRHFVAKGHHRFTIDPAAENERAIRCYAAVGFQPVGRLRAYERAPDGRWRDGLLMERVAEELRPSTTDPDAPASLRYTES